MDNVSIEIRQKTEKDSYDDIWNLIYNAHEENRSNGIIVNPDIKNGSMLKDLQGPDAVCFLALHGEKIVGTLSARIQKGMYWKAKNLTFAFFMNLAVDSDYRGCGIAKELFKKCEDYAKSQNVDGIEFKVLEKNPAANIYRHLGYKDTDFLPKKSLKAFSIYMIKWLKPQPYPDFVRIIRFNLKKIFMKIKYRW